MANITLFSQIILKLDRSKFNKIVKDKETDKHCKGYNSWTHLVSMLFCQFAKVNLSVILVMVFDQQLAT